MALKLCHTIFTMLHEGDDWGYNIKPPVLHFVVHTIHIIAGITIDEFRNANLCIYIYRRWRSSYQEWRV